MASSAYKSRPRIKDILNDLDIQISEEQKDLLRLLRDFLTDPTSKNLSPEMVAFLTDQQLRSFAREFLDTKISPGDETAGQKFWPKGGLLSKNWEYPRDLNLISTRIFEVLILQRDNKSAYVQRKQRELIAGSPDEFDYIEGSGSRAGTAENDDGNLKERLMCPPALCGMVARRATATFPLHSTIPLGVADRDHEVTSMNGTSAANDTTVVDAHKNKKRTVSDASLGDHGLRPAPVAQSPSQPDASSELTEAAKPQEHHRRQRSPSAAPLVASGVLMRLGMVPQLDLEQQHRIMRAVWKDWIKAMRYYGDEYSRALRREARKEAGNQQPHLASECRQKSEWTLEIIDKLDEKLTRDQDRMLHAEELRLDDD